MHVTGNAGAYTARMACALTPESIPTPTALHEMRAQLRAFGAGPRHESMLLRRWVRGQPLDHASARAPELPKPLLQALPALAAAWQRIAVRQAGHPAPDGGERWLVGLADGQTIESVLLPRESLCVSTQVGCAVGCAFCMTGQSGLLRQLGSAEIAAQVALARRARPLRTVVFMGMGEPAHNLEAVMDAIELLGTEGGIGHKSLVLSTVGDERVFERIPQGPVRPALALSLHSTDAARRASLLPRAPRFEPAELVARALDCTAATAHPLLVQWTLIEGLNDGDDEVEGLTRLLAGRRALLNMIPVNRVDGLDFQRPSSARCETLLQRLRAAGVHTTLRHSAAQEVDGGCGQLRARSLGERPLRRAPRPVVA